MVEGLLSWKMYLLYNLFQFKSLLDVCTYLGKKTSQIYDILYEDELSVKYFNFECNTPFDWLKN